MEKLKNTRFTAKRWGNDEKVTGKLSLRDRVTLKTTSELLWTKREDGTSFPTNPNGYIIGIETEKGFEMVDPDTIEINETKYPFKHRWHFDCWDKTGKMQCITIKALDKENAIELFNIRHEDLKFDQPY